MKFLTVIQKKFNFTFLFWNTIIWVFSQLIDKLLGENQWSKWISGALDTSFKASRLFSIKFPMSTANSITSENEVTIFRFRRNCKYFRKCNYRPIWIKNVHMNMTQISIRYRDQAVQMKSEELLRKDVEQRQIIRFQIDFHKYHQRVQCSFSLFFFFLGSTA